MSSIAADQLPGDDSIYRRGGRLQKLMAANPTVGNPKRLPVGTQVVLPVIQAIYVKIDLRAPAAELDRSPLIQAPDRTAVQEAVVASPDEATPAPSRVVVGADANTLAPVFEVNLNAAFYDIRSREQATGASANFVSDFTPGVGIVFSQPWSDKWSTYGAVDYFRIKIMQPNSSARVQQPTAQKNLAVGLKRESDHVTLALEAGLTQNIFPRAVATNEFTFDTLTVPYTRVKLGVAPIQTSQANLGFVAIYDYLGEANSGPQRARTGKNLGGEVYWSYRFKSQRSYRLGLTYNKNEQSTNLSAQEHSSLGLGFTLSWPLGD